MEDRSRSVRKNKVVFMVTNQQLSDFLEVWQRTLNWQPDRSQCLQFQKLYREILLANRQFNLTRITEPQEFWEKHLWDSLSGLLRFSGHLDRDFSVIDIGTGAGFPGVPVAIAYPNWSITLLDSTQKKISFLKNLIQNLSLKNVKTLIGRAEVIGQEKQHREAYDLVLIRAVASVSVCAEYTLPFLKVGGRAILYRGHWSEEENIALQKAIERLGGKIEKIDAFTTPLTQSIRHCIYLYKYSSTSREFPKAIGVPSQYPL